VDNADHGAAGSDQQHGEAIGGDDGQRKLRAISEQRIGLSAARCVGVVTFGEHDDAIAMHLAERHQGLGVKANRSSETTSIVPHTWAVIAASEPEIQPCIGRLTHPPETGTEGVNHREIAAQGRAREEQYAVSVLQAECLRAFDHHPRHSAGRRASEMVRSHHLRRSQLALPLAESAAVLSYED
jgi:hypothetical protein